ncbi:MAG: DUF4381 domain-containing protein [Ketobacteraceae bacterium]|nr:DUF4381 domain-containing protein [Ketobacteraceae bacterium]
MNQTDPLANLAPIHLPDPVSQWPPAPGWWILGALLLTLLAGLVIWQVKRYRKYAFRREALARLQHIEQHKDHLTSVEVASQLSGLLKQVAITLFGRQHTASLSGEAWLRFLDDKGKTDAFTQGPGRALADDIYRPGATVDLDGIFKLGKQWIEKQS